MHTWAIMVWSLQNHRMTMLPQISWVGMLRPFLFYVVFSCGKKSLVTPKSMSVYWSPKERKKNVKGIVESENTGFRAVVLLDICDSTGNSVLCIINCLPGWGLCGHRALWGSHRCICSLDLSCVKHDRLRQGFLRDRCCSFCLYHSCHSGCVICLHCRSCCGAGSDCLCRSEIKPWQVKSRHKLRRRPKQGCCQTFKSLMNKSVRRKKSY